MVPSKEVTASFAVPVYKATALVVDDGAAVLESKGQKPWPTWRSELSLRECCSWVGEGGGHRLLPLLQRELN